MNDKKRSQETSETAKKNKKQNSAPIQLPTKPQTVDMSDVFADAIKEIRRK